MCNHYSGDPQGLFDFVRKMAPWVQIHDPSAEVLPQLFPKRLGYVVRKVQGVAELMPMRWGVWPFYQKTAPKLVTNSRSDGLLTKAIWKQSARHRRCLVPASGYYEPGLGPVGSRGEVLFSVRERPQFFIAGLWDNDSDNSGGAGYSLVTAEPNDYVRPFHDRMPVVLSDTEALDWLGDEPLPDAGLIELCRGLPSEALIHEEIAARPREKLTIIRPAKKPPEPPPQLTLF